MYDLDFYTDFGVAAIEVAVLLVVCGFVVDICDDLAFFVFMRCLKMVVLLSCVA